MLFSQNSFRILGVLSTSGQREIKKNISKFNAYAKLGRKIDLDYDLNFLNLLDLERTTNILQKSENKINLDQNKIKISLFWFADITPIDSVALANLIKGDVSKSIEIWEKNTKSKTVSLKNYSSFHNLSTLLFLKSLDKTKTDTFIKDDTSIEVIRRAIKLKSDFLSSTSFNNYCESITKSVPISSNEANQFFISSLLELLKNNFSAIELSDIFEGLDDQLNDIVQVSLTETPVLNIKNNLEIASDSISKDKKSGVEAGKQLIKNTQKDIEYLKEISGSDDYKFQTLSDKLSNQILQGGIDFYNETGEDQDYLSSYEYALSIAISEETKDRAKECIEHCKKANENANQNRLFQLIQKYDEKYEKWVQDVAEATEARANFKGSDIKGPPGASMWGAPSVPGGSIILISANSLASNVKKPYASLIEKYGDDNQLVIDIGTGLINRIVNCAVMNLNEQIKNANSLRGTSQKHYDKRTDIIKSLEGIKKLLNKISKIKGNKEALKYKNETMRFLLDNLKIIENNRRESSPLMQGVRELQARERANNNRSGGCYIATMAYGEYDHPQVLELRKFRDEILERSLIGRLFIRIYYRFSPRLVMHMQYKKRINVLIKKGLDNFINQYLK